MNEAGLSELPGRTVEEDIFVATVSLEERAFEGIAMPTRIKEDAPDVGPVFVVTIKEPRGIVLQLF
ncbi:hypothetical protein C5S39_13480 [Candidatus Methanophagaceae archaeon]|nr:hypothetical protein C5S39_13480 [Methanophagales archaeon]